MRRKHRKHVSGWHVAALRSHYKKAKAEYHRAGNALGRATGVSRRRKHSRARRSR